MWVRKFRGRTLPEALAQVKLELGPEAVILHTANIKVGGLFGLFGKGLIEVTAAADRNGSPVQGAPQPAPALVAAAASARVAPAVAPTLGPAPVPDPGFAAVKNEVQSMKAMMGLMMQRMQIASEAVVLEPDLKELYELFLQGGVEEEVAMELTGRVREQLPSGSGNLARAKALARNLMEADLGTPQPVSTSPGRRRVVALVGSTGVGKTTTLAKLAAHFSFGRRLQVGLITADTYRVAAVEQLRTYSDILGIPLEVVYDPSELPAALARLRAKDLVLVDMAGRSHRNPEHMKELQAHLEILTPDEIYLTLSLASGYRSIAAAVQRYKPLGVQRMIYTKWDEAEAPGLIYTLTRRYGLPLSYITNGQNVPDDIEVANPPSIIRAILGD